jgi:hypothetical protein
VTVPLASFLHWLFKLYPQRDDQCLFSHPLSPCPGS